MTDITLREFDATPKDVRLYTTPIAALASTIIFLSSLSGTPTDIILRDTTVAPGGGSFPTQFAGLRYFSGTVKELCLVALGDASGGVRVVKNGTTYSAYLVETSDPNASGVRVQTGVGIKAIRLKT